MKKQVFVILDDEEKRVLADKAKSLALLNERGPKAGEGNISKLMSAIASGQILLITSANIQ